MSSERGSQESSEKKEWVVKRIEELIARIEKNLEELEKQEIPNKRELIEKLSDIVEELEDAVDRFESHPELELLELKEVTNMLRVLGDVGRDIIGSVIGKLMELMDGKRLGENISALYTSLKNAGMPDPIIQEIIKDYVNKALSMANIGEIVEKLLPVITQRKVEKEEKE